MSYLANKMIELRIKYIKDLDQKKIKQKDVVFALGTSRQTVSKWLAVFRVEGEAGLYPKKPGPKKGDPWNKTPKEMEDQVVALAEDHPFKGPDWIADELPFDINGSTVYRILKREKIRYELYYKHKRRKKKAYCLDKPGRELQLDIHFPFGYSRKEVVIDAIDDCSRFVFAKVMPNHTQGSVIEFMKQLIGSCPFPVKVIRTDCGREFGKEFAQFLAQNNIEHKKNPPYTPQHNGKIERYHRTFKEDEVCFWPFNASVEELNYRLALWLQYYNFKRKHTGLGMKKMTPIQKILYAFIHHSFLPHKNVNLILQENKI